MYIWLDRLSIWFVLIESLFSVPLWRYTSGEQRCWLYGLIHFIGGFVASRSMEQGRCTIDARITYQLLSFIPSVIGCEFVSVWLVTFAPYCYKQMMRVFVYILFMWTLHIILNLFPCSGNCNCIPKTSNSNDKKTLNQKKMRCLFTVHKEARYCQTYLWFPDPCQTQSCLGTGQSDHRGIAFTRQTNTHNVALQLAADIYKACGW
jgi:hypothetical protein